MIQWNHVTLAGRLGADPEAMVTSGGKHLTKTRMAVALSSDRTMWLELVLWGDTGTRLRENAEKGTGIIVAGRLESDEYTDRDGNARKKYYITVHAFQIIEGWRGESRQHGTGMKRANTMPRVPKSDPPFDVPPDDFTGGGDVPF